MIKEQYEQNRRDLNTLTHIYIYIETYIGTQIHTNHYIDLWMIARELGVYGF